MKTITSENLDIVHKYTYVDKIATSEYGSFIRYLVMTMKKELAVEVLNNADDRIIKGLVANFSLDYKEKQEGENDNLTINLTLDGKEERTIQLLNLGKEGVSKDSQNSPRTFYRFYIYPESNEEGYRITFNRRVTK